MVTSQPQQPPQPITEEKIRNFIKQVLQEQMLVNDILFDDVWPTTEFFNLDLDSLDLVEVYIALEREYHFIFCEMRIDGFNNFQDIINYVKIQVNGYNK